jgi:stage II sporulation protein D
LLEKVEQQMAMLERSTGLLYEVRPLVRFYPSVAAYRDTTGEPGWMAASTRDNTIRLQPVTTLRSSGTLEATLFHELAHVLIESKAHPSVPRWFREGLVLWLTESSEPVAQVAVPADPAVLERSITKPASEAELRRAYREARAAVAGLAQKHGRDVVLSWLRKGLPQTR